jgi:hypothetical protein
MKLFSMKGDGCQLCLSRSIGDGEGDILYLIFQTNLLILTFFILSDTAVPVEKSKDCR